MIRPTNILLAEDDVDDRDLFLEAIYLADPSIKVATVENGEKLMSHLQESTVSPDCIFLDLNMPKKSGKECLKEIRANEKTKKIPIVIYTTSLNTKDIDETFVRGASNFMRKPSTFSELRELLQRYITSFQTSNVQRVKNNFVLNSR
jgi:CheY-like chemotaxis protein